MPVWTPIRTQRRAARPATTPPTSASCAATQPASASVADAKATKQESASVLTSTPPWAGPRRPHDAPVLFQHPRVRRPQSAEQARRALDVGEYEGDRRHAVARAPQSIVSHGSASFRDPIGQNAEHRDHHAHAPTEPSTDSSGRGRPAAPGMGYRPALDGVRAIAVAAVVLFHFEFALDPGRLPRRRHLLRRQRLPHHVVDDRGVGPHRRRRPPPVLAAPGPAAAARALR